MRSTGSPLASRALIGLLLAFAVGALARLIWVQDMEFKVDEAWMHELVRDFFREGRFVWLGMPSSQNLRIPGLSVWQFYPLGAAFGLEPTGLARGVQVLNLLALAALAVFAWRVVPIEEREWWLWAVALLCVNPCAVLFHRKIWPPCAMTLGIVTLLACWWQRRSRWGSLGWGMLAALLFQIHVLFLFHVAALAGCTLLFDRRSVRWRWWLLGGALGALPAIPWVWYMLTTHDGVGGNAWKFSRLIEFKFWGYWVVEGIGVGMDYWFGADADRLLGWPTIAGRPTYGVALLQAIPIVVLVCGVARMLWRVRRDGLPFSGPGQSHLLLLAVFCGFGLSVTLAGLRFYRHYLLLAFPFPSLLLARLVLPPRGSASELWFGRRTLLAVCVANALMTAATLLWVHQHGGGERGSYGRSFASQRQRGEKLLVPPLPAW